jgi:hypothetical protein
MQLARRPDITEPRSALSWARVLALLAAFLMFMSGAPYSADALTQPGFPRIAIWWPDSAAEPLANRARCDWTALQNHDADHIAELRRANPEIIVLGTTNAREINYVLGDYDNGVNVELRGVSTDWILTQAGSTLAQGITASAMAIPVADATRFAVGEMVLVDHELMHVEAIRDSTLVVSARGPVNPPASHVATTRIAPVMSNWPGSITMDLSVNCPKRDAGHGLETWSDWNVRRSQAALDSAPWDGLLIDCLDGDPHWMVTVGNNRSIDENRDNVADDLAAFDAAWNPGAAAYGDALPVACEGKILVSNGHMRNFKQNGTVFEGFPHPDLSLKDWGFVFCGPWYSSGGASYPEWCARAATPNLTMIQTYGGPTDYKMMRYGLCSALLNDGYYAYGAHAPGPLLWFDEYDNAGAGRGYLGQPSGDAVKVGNAYRRDYDGGIALVNPTSSAVTVQLGGVFRKINGTQDRAVNDGSLVTAVALQPHDGIVLLRISPTSSPVAVLRASDSTIEYGGKTTLQVAVAPAAAAPVRIERWTAGTKAWSRVATMTTGADGLALLARTQTVTTKYRVVLVGTGAVSKVVTVGVRPRVTLRASRKSVSRGGVIAFSGTVTHPGRVTVRLQRYSGGRWRNVKLVRTSVSGRYSTKLSLLKRGSFSYRAYVVHDTSHFAAKSATVRIVVR